MLIEFKRCDHNGESEHPILLKADSITTIEGNSPGTTIRHIQGNIEYAIYTTEPYESCISRYLDAMLPIHDYKVILSKYKES